MTRKNIFNKVTNEVNNEVVTTKNEVEERKPFIISVPLTKAINSPTGAVDRFAADAVTDPSAYNENYGIIDLLDPTEYHDAVLKGANSIINQYSDANPTIAYSLAKDEFDNSHYLSELSNSENGTPVRINNFSDAMIAPTLASMEIFKDFENNDFFNNDDQKQIIFNMIKAKIRSCLRNIMTTFIIRYNTDITNSIGAYIATASINGNNIDDLDPNLILTTVGDSYRSGANICFDDNLVLSPIYENIGRILLNNTNESLKENVNKYMAQADVSVNMCLIRLYDIIEYSVLNNFVNYMNEHISSLSPNVARDIQLIIVDRLAPNVMLIKSDLLSMINNILSDIDMYYLPILEDSDGTDNKKKRRDDEYYYESESRHPYDYRYRIPYIG